MALIQIHKLTKLYRMGDSIVRALDGVDLDIERGEFVAITGASGSGKSTLMHLIGCLDRPTGGTYRLNDRDVSELSDRELARVRNEDIGFVFQTFNLINRTPAVDNVGIPLFYARNADTRGPALAALERVGLEHRATHKPSELSGGERQRVSIARAIVNDPIVLLADEPTGNLDSRTGEQIMEIFHQLNEQGVTIIIVTHEHDVARQARRIVHMKDGRIVSDQASDRSTRPMRPAQVTESPDQADTHDDTAPREDAADFDALPARMARGANSTLGLGITASVLLVAAIVGYMLVRAMAADFGEFTEQRPPPTNLVVLGLASVSGFLLSLIVGVLAIFWGRGVFKRIRVEPGNWLGRKRARVGWALGWTTVAIPVLFVSAQFVRGALQFGSA